MRHTPRSSLAGEVARELPLASRALLPTPLLLALLPAGLVAVVTPGRWAVVGALPLLLLGYAPYPFFLPTYLIAAVPAAVTACVLGLRTIERAWPAARAAVGLGSLVAVALATAWTLPETQPGGFTFAGGEPVSRYAHEVLPYVVQTPAVVLFRYDLGSGTYDDEPVYNPGVIWPDDAEIIMAHDLGPQNDDLLAYYADRQPERAVYLFDRRSMRLELLGLAGDLPGQMRDAGAAVPVAAPSDRGVIVVPAPPTGAEPPGWTIGDNLRHPDPDRPRGARHPSGPRLLALVSTATRERRRGVRLTSDPRPRSGEDRCEWRSNGQQQERHCGSPRPDLGRRRTLEEPPAGRDRDAIIEPGRRRAGHPIEGRSGAAGGGADTRDARRAMAAARRI